MQIKNSTRKDKRYMAIFRNGKIVHFGLKDGSTYIDNKDKNKRDAYIARHQVRENFNDPYSAGALSRWLLWGDYATLDKNHIAFMKKFREL
jgi:hypothetical protein